MLDVIVQADVTVLVAPEHVAQAVQGDVPVLDHVEPAMQEGAGAQTVFAVAVQAVVTAPEHVVQAVQGDVPVLDHVEPAMQEGAGTPQVVFTGHGVHVNPKLTPRGQEIPAVPPLQVIVTPGTTGQGRQTPPLRKLPDVQVVTGVTHIVIFKLTTNPEGQATAADTPPAHADPEGQGKHPVALTKSPTLQDVGVKQAVDAPFTYSPGAHEEGGEDPPAQINPAGHATQ